MQHKKPNLPDEGLGKFTIFSGIILMILPLFFSRMGWGQKLPAIAGGFSGLSWGLGQVAAAKKWRQAYGEPTLEEKMAVKKNHSISNLPKLLAWIFLPIVALYLLPRAYIMFSHH